MEDVAKVEIVYINHGADTVKVEGTVRQLVVAVSDVDGSTTINELAASYGQEADALDVVAYTGTNEIARLEGGVSISRDNFAVPFTVEAGSQETQIKI